MPITNPITESVKDAIDQVFLEASLHSYSDLGEILSFAFANLIALEIGYAGVDPWLQDFLKFDGLYVAVRDGRLRTGKHTLNEHAADVTLLSASSTNYVEIDPVNGLVSNTSSFTSGFWPLCVIETGTADFGIEDITDARPLRQIVHGKRIAASNLDDSLADKLPSASVSFSSEVDNKRTVSVQLKDAQNNNLAESRVIEVWLSDDATSWQSADPPSGGLDSVTTGTLLETLSSGVRWRFATSAAGLLQIVIAESGADTWYVRLILDNGVVVTSAAMAFAS